MLVLKKIMSKLNKIFLAVIIALLVVAVAEVIFIFVYKPTQSIPVPQTPVATNPSPTPLPVGTGKPDMSATFLSNIGAWPSYLNQNTTLTNNITGVITSIGKPEQVTMQTPQGSKTEILTYIHLAGTSQDVRVVGFTQQEWGNIKAYDLSKNGSQTPINVSGLVPGDSIQISEVFNANTSDGSSPDNIIINRMK